MSVGLYAKALVGAAVAGLTVALTGLGDGSLSGYEWTLIAGAVLVSLGGIFATSNTKSFRYAKAVVGALIAGVGALGIALVDGGGVTSQEFVNILIALAGGAGLVAITPNADQSDEFGVLPGDAHL